MTYNELKSFYEDCFKEYGNIKDELKNVSSNNSEMFKGFAITQLGDKKLKKKVADYCKDKQKLDDEKLTIPDVVKARLDDLELNDAQTEQLRGIYSHYTDNEYRKTRLRTELGGVLDSFAVQTGKDATEVRVFFSYMFQKATKGYSPIDAIDVIKEMAVTK